MSRIGRLRQDLLLLKTRLMPTSETRKATAFWAGLPDYHLTNDESEEALVRSRWLADSVVPSLDIDSLLEVGTNSGRNLQVIRASHPAMRLRGIDVNKRAIAFAQSKGIDVDFVVADANHWAEPPLSWDAILTMSVLDHIPDEAITSLAANMVASARQFLIVVELWDGGEGVRGPYKYSRNSERLFQNLGVRTIHWAEAPGQYAPTQSKLWAFIGDCSRLPIEKVGREVPSVKRASA